MSCHHQCIMVPPAYSDLTICAMYTSSRSLHLLALSQRKKAFALRDWSRLDLDRALNNGHWGPLHTDASSNTTQSRLITMRTHNHVLRRTKHLPNVDGFSYVSDWTLLHCANQRSKTHAISGATLLTSPTQSRISRFVAFSSYRANCFCRPHLRCRKTEVRGQAYSCSRTNRSMHLRLVTDLHASASESALLRLAFDDGLCAPLSTQYYSEMMLAALEPRYMHLTMGMRQRLDTKLATVPAHHIAAIAQQLNMPSDSRCRMLADGLI